MISINVYNAILYYRRKFCRSAGNLQLTTYNLQLITYNLTLNESSLSHHAVYPP